MARWIQKGQLRLSWCKGSCLLRPQLANRWLLNFSQTLASAWGPTVPHLPHADSVRLDFGPNGPLGLAEIDCSVEKTGCFPLCRGAFVWCVCLQE